MFKRAMPRALWQASFRYLWRHPWLAGLSVLGVALGVAVVVSIDLAGTSASRAFSLSTESVAGNATHQIVGPGGWVDGDVYRRLRIEQGYRASAPVVEGYAVDPETDRTFQILGIDPLAEGPFRPYVTGENVDLAAFMAEDPTVLMAAPTAEALGWAVGDSLQMQVDGVDHRLRLVGLIEPGDERTRRATENLLIMDVAAAQRLMGRPGELSHIDLIVEGAQSEAVLEDIQRGLPEGLEIVRSEARTETVEQMTRAFDLNLTALSLLALIVGMFLIYNTITFSVVQRRELLGRLRALGVTRGEIFALVLGEAALLGVIGTVVGLLIGIGLAQGLVQLITQTISDLYFVLTVRELTLSPWVLAKGTALGLGATLFAALVPAREAAQAPVSAVLRRSQAETNVQAQVPKLTGAGVLLAVLSAVLLLLPTRSITISYVALFALLMAAALLTPAGMLVLSRGLQPVMSRAFGVLGRMAARGMTAALSRTAVAVAALMIAVSATIGVGVMVDSFRQTVVVWLDHSLQSDVYVQAPGGVFRRSDATLLPEVEERLRAAEGVMAASSVRRVEVTGPAGPTELVAMEPGPHTAESYRFKEGDPQAAWSDLAAGAASVIVSEPYSYRTGLTAGDSLTLQTDRGRQRFRVLGVYFDYASDLGVVTMSRATYERFYDDRAISGLALLVDPERDVDALLPELRQEVAGVQDVIVRSNRGLREASLEVFDRTFTITTVLRLLAVIVAFIGVVSALTALQLERSHEIAVLRAGGMTSGQAGWYMTLQTSLMGLIAGLLSMPLGLVLASVLTYVINRRSFGWTLQFQVAPEILGQALLLALGAAVLAGLYPARKMRRTLPAEALRV